jgi:hypothetical protein
VPSDLVIWGCGHFNLKFFRICPDREDKVCPATWRNAVRKQKHKISLHMGASIGSNSPKDSSVYSYRLMHHFILHHLILVPWTLVVDAAAMIKRSTSVAQDSANRIMNTIMVDHKM